MTVTLFGEGAVATACNVTLYLSQGELKLTDVLVQKVTGNYTTHQAKVAAVAPMASDNEGLTPFILTMINPLPYYVGTNRHATWASVMRSNPMENVLVEVTAAVYTDLRSGTQQTIEGRIVQVLDFTPEACAFLVDQRERMQQGWIPAKVLDDGFFTTDAEKKKLPKDSKARAIPVPLGKAVPYRMPLLANMTDGQTSRLIDSGFESPMFPALEVQRNEDTSTFAWAEKITGTGALSIDVAGQELSEVLDAYVWSSDANAWGNVWDNDVAFDSAADAAGFYKTAIKRQPYVRFPLTAQRYISAESTGTADNPERAIDGKHETFSILTSGRRAVYEVRNWNGGGHISANSQEGGAGTALQNWEGTGYPAGLRAFATLYFYSNVPTSGTINLAITFPGSPTSGLFGVSTTYAIAGLTSEGMQALNALQIFHYLQICDSSGNTGGVDDGWNATKFERGDFSAHGNPSGAYDPNRPLARSGSNDSRQFRVTITSTLNQPVMLAAIGMQVAVVESLQRGSDAWFNINEIKKLIDKIAKAKGRAKDLVG